MDVLKVENRDTSLKPKKLRRQGIIPGCIYGSNIEDSISIQTKQSDLMQLMKTKTKGSKLSLDLEGKKYNVLIKDINYGILSSEIEHIGFQNLVMDEVISSIAVIELKNKEKIQGLIQQLITEVPYKAYPTDLVEKIEIDLDGMKVGDSVKISDIKQLNKEGIELSLDADSVVFTISEGKKVAVEDSQGEESSDSETNEE